MNLPRSADNAQKPASPASQFDEIAFLYDELMVGVPYRAWFGYVQHILDRFGCRPHAVLDLCCGTGSLSLLLAEEGYQVSGVDVSPNMIALAECKAEESGFHIDYRVQSASSLHLGRRFDLVVSVFDSLNYVLESSALQEVFHGVSEHLQPGGLFIFDMNTELALAGGLFDQGNVGGEGPIRYDWYSSYDPAGRICSIQMNFLYRAGGSDRRVEVVHYQRAYDEEEIVEMLNTSGLEICAVYHAYTFRKATKRSDRIFFVARK